MCRVFALWARSPTNPTRLSEYCSAGHRYRLVAFCLVRSTRDCRRCVGCGRKPPLGGAKTCSQVILRPQNVIFSHFLGSHVTFNRRGKTWFFHDGLVPVSARGESVAGVLGLGLV